jgi:hypothetical protein
MPVFFINRSSEIIKSMLLSPTTTGEWLPRVCFMRMVTMNQHQSELQCEMTGMISSIASF